MKVVVKSRSRKRGGKRSRKMVIYRRPYTRAVRVMNYKREFFKQQVGSAGGGIALSFKLTDLPNSSSFTSMFDQYRIMAVVFKYVPYMNATGGYGAVNLFTAANFIGMDFNDNTVPGTRDDILRLRYHKSWNAYRRFTYKIKPRAESILYNTAITVSYGNASRKTWIDTSSDTVPYYCLKAFFTNNSSSVDFLGDIFLTYYVQFRNIQL